MQVLCNRKNSYGKRGGEKIVYGDGIIGGRIGGCGNEGAADGVVRNGSKDGLAVSVAFKSMACPFLYAFKVMVFPGILFWPI